MRRHHYACCWCRNTGRVRWNYVVSNLIQVLASLFYMYYIFERFCIPMFRDFTSEYVTPRRLLVSIFGCILPGTLVLFIGMSIPLSVPLSARLSVYLRVAARLSGIVHWYVCLSVCVLLPGCLVLFIGLSVCLSVCLRVAARLSGTVHWYVCLSVHLSVYLSICMLLLGCLVLFIGRFVCLFVCLSVCALLPGCLVLFICKLSLHELMWNVTRTQHIWHQRNDACQLIILWLTVIYSVFDRVTANRQTHVWQ